MPTDVTPPRRPGGKTASGAVAFLKRKELGLPIWAWGLITAILLYVLYRRFGGGGRASSKSPTQTATDATQVPPSDTGGGGGGGSPPLDTSGDLASAGGLPFVFLGNGGGYPYDFSSLYSNNPGDGNPTATIPVAGLGPLDWGGQSYTTRAQFNAYLKSKGISAAQFATNHPAAYSHYLALPAGVSKTAASSGTRQLAQEAPIIRAGATIGAAIGGSSRPVKQSPTSTFKAPVFSDYPILKGIGSNGRTVTLLQPTYAAKTVVPESSPIKAPAKSAVKPRPAPTPVFQPRESNPRPPVRRKK